MNTKIKESYILIYLTIISYLINPFMHFVNKVDHSYEIIKFYIQVIQHGNNQFSIIVLTHYREIHNTTKHQSDTFEFLRPDLLVNLKFNR